MPVEILDIGSGNVRSVKNWVERANVQTRIVTKAAEISSDILIVPGVGSAGPYMDRLKAGKFDLAIHDHLSKGGRLLGICLGFQIMADYSEEDGGVEGLGILPGFVERLPDKISHNSWESFYLKKKNMVGNQFNSSRSLSRKQVIDGRVFFNHEYGFLNKDSSAYTLPVSSELTQYSALAVKNNIIGIQFHPEKSQKTGLELVSMIL